MFVLLWQCLSGDERHVCVASWDCTNDQELNEACKNKYKRCGSAMLKPITSYSSLLVWPRLLSTTNYMYWNYCIKRNNKMPFLQLFFLLWSFFVTVWSYGFCTILIYYISKQATPTATANRYIKLCVWRMSRSWKLEPTKPQIEIQFRFFWLLR